VTSRLLLLGLALTAVLAPGAALAQPERPARRPGVRGRPAASRPAPCRRDRDEVLPLRYPDAGQVWIPRELVCGGRADVILLLHGNQSGRDPTPAINGGRHLERLTRQLISSGAVRPVILAEPVQYSACGNGRDLFGYGVSFVEYKKRLFRLLGGRTIRPGSFAVIAHSGSGCCTGGGVFKAAKQLRPLRLVATSDTCSGAASYSERLKEVLGPGTVYLNVSRGEPAHERYRAFEMEMLGRRPRAFRPCDPLLYRRCLRHPGRPYSSYTTRRLDVGYHDSIPGLALRIALLRYFGGLKGERSAPRHAEPPAPPDLMGPPAPPEATSPPPPPP
jgi:hypothetical protein